MTRALAIARVSGIEIRVQLGWVVLLAFITVFMARALAWTEADGPEALRYVVGAITALLFLFSVAIHELAHGIVARRRGQAVVQITLTVIGGQTTTDAEPTRAVDELAVAAAGPALSLVVGGALVIASAVLAGVADIAAAVLLVIGAVNGLLGLLNLVPALPLDGGRIVRALAWRSTGDRARANRLAFRTGGYVGYVAIGSGLLVSLLLDGVTGIVLVLSGWFIVQGSRLGQGRAAIEALLAGVRVDEAMERDVPSIGPDLTIDTFADQLLMDGERTSVPVVGDGSLLGIIGVRQLRRIARRRWSALRASDVMVALPALPSLGAGDALWTGMEALRRSGLDGIPVMSGSALLGILTQRGVMKTIQARVPDRLGGAR